MSTLSTDDPPGNGGRPFTPSRPPANATPPSPTYDNLCRLTLPSWTSELSVVSLDDAPPLNRRPALRIYVLDGSTLANHSPRVKSKTQAPEEVLISIPTRNRLKKMLIEPIHVRKWLESSLAAPMPDSAPWEGADADIEVRPWIPEGSLYSPGNFWRMLHPHGGYRDSGHPPPRVDNSAGPFIPASASEISIFVSDAASHIADVSISVITEDADEAAAVPTIMISNSTAAVPVPLSLESSHSLATIVPLAIRRGKQPPKALALERPPQSLDTDSASSFAYLESPTLGSPTFEFSSGNPDKLTMSLEAMCADLKSKCPELHSATVVEEDASSWDHSSPATTNKAEETYISVEDSDEWAFAQDLLKQYGDTKNLALVSSMSANITHRHLAKIERSTTDDGESTEAESFSWASTQTFTDSKDDVDAQTVAAKSPATTRLQRRKTVIIETFDIKEKLAESIVDNEKMDTTAVVDDDRTDLLVLPEPSRPRSLSAPTTSSRPGSGTLRGILKGSRTKCVRFSSSDPDRPFEYPGQETTRSCPTSPATPSTRKGSPLRRSFVPDSPTTPSTASASAESPVSHLPKHPAARAIARNTIALGASPTPTKSSPLRPPMPAFFVDQHRAPLRSLNGHQSLPAERNSQAIIEASANVPPPAAVAASPLPSRFARMTHKTVLKEDISRPRRLMKTASTALPTPTRTQGKENVTPPQRRRASEGGSGSAQKGRILSFITRFRA